MHSNLLMQKVMIFKGFWSIQDVKNHKEWLFVFGDNDAGYGKGGQAIIRDEPNTIGIPTKKFPTNDEWAFYSDEEYDRNIGRINDAFEELYTKFWKNEYQCIVLPENGLGTGLADLPKRAPKTYEYLQQQIKELETKL